MFTPVEHEVRGWPGKIDDDHVVQLAAQTLEAFFTGGGQAREHAAFRLSDVRLLAPVRRPPSVRDFYAFEEHVQNAARVTGRPGVPDEWYEIPTFYFSNPAAIYGPDEEIPYPEGSAALDYELEVAAIIGADGQIGGFTIMNDWSARDLQRREMRIGLGPAKGKDFATTIGPWIVTPDELGPRWAAGAGAPDLAMTATVTGADGRRLEVTRGSWASARYSFAQMLARASADVHLRAGEILGSGTVGTGCLLEVKDQTLGRWLEPGDLVSVAIDGIGEVQTPIVVRPTR